MNNTPTTKKQIAYIFKSKRARRLMIEAQIGKDYVKELQGKTFPVVAQCSFQYSIYIEIKQPKDWRWNIPLDACNVIDVEEGEEL